MRPIGNNGTLANAAPCAHNYLGSYLDRPLAGSINFNPGSDLILSLIADPTDAFLFDQVSLLPFQFSSWYNFIFTPFRC